MTVLVAVAAVAIMDALQGKSVKELREDRERKLAGQMRKQQWKDERQYVKEQHESIARHVRKCMWKCARTATPAERELTRLGMDATLSWAERDQCKRERDELGRQLMEAEGILTMSEREFERRYPGYLRNKVIQISRFDSNHRRQKR
jgi:hypothetical protein